PDDRTRQHVLYFFGCLSKDSVQAYPVFYEERRARQLHSFYPFLFCGALLITVKPLWMFWQIPSSRRQGDPGGGQALSTHFPASDSEFSYHFLTGCADLRHYFDLPALVHSLVFRQQADGCLQTE